MATPFPVVVIMFAFIGTGIIALFTTYFVFLKNQFETPAQKSAAGATMQIFYG